MKKHMALQTGAAHETHVFDCRAASLTLDRATRLFFDRNERQLKASNKNTAHRLTSQGNGDMPAPRERVVPRKHRVIVTESNQ